MNQLYPLKFKTIFKEKLWGGQKIKTLLGKDFGDLANCGETWELSGVPGNISVVSDGPLAGKDLKSLIREFDSELVGLSVHAIYGDDFPLLIKFIDADQDLSIQVHPNDQLAKERHNSFGKTEMWYVMQADRDATLISGFNRELNKQEYLEKFNQGKLMDILNREKVETDDVFFLPAGRVHTIGKGLLIAEIQQTSDVTYRIYDFDRRDVEGNKRELHVEEALDAIDYQHYDDYKTQYQDLPNVRVPLVDCPYFTTNKLWLDRDYTVDMKSLDSFKIYVCLEGEGELKTEESGTTLKKGDVVLVPAVIQHYELETPSGIKLLESYIKV